MLAQGEDFAYHEAATGAQNVDELTHCQQAQFQTTPPRMNRHIIDHETIATYHVELPSDGLIQIVGVTLEKSAMKSMKLVAVIVANVKQRDAFVHG
jgi:hypothetical protein